MWPIGTNTQNEIKKTHQHPYYNFRLYDDLIDFTGTVLGTNGTMEKYFFNTKNQKQYAVTGTQKVCSLNGFAWEGTNIALTGTYQIGTWISPKLTTYVKDATWHALLYRDFTFGRNESDIVFKERFETWDGMIRNGAQQTLSEGGITYFGSYNIGNWLKIVNHGNELTGVEYPYINVGNEIKQTGEIDLSYRCDNFYMNNLEVFRLHTSDSKDNFGLYQVTSGTTIGLYFTIGYTDAGSITTQLGTIGTGQTYQISCAWGTQAGNKYFINSSINGTTSTGTSVPGILQGDFRRFSVAEYVGGSSGTYFIGDLVLFGTASPLDNGTNTWLKHNATINYYIRTSDNGTSFSDWRNITGTRKYNLDARRHNVLYSACVGGVCISAKFAQLMAVANTTGTQYRPYINTIRTYSTWEIPPSYIKTAPKVEYQLDGKYTMGLIKSNTMDFELSNIADLYFDNEQLFNSTATSNWINQSQFFNRPPTNFERLRLKTGYSGTWGTETTPIWHGWVNYFNLNSNDKTIKITAVDDWGRYGDLPLGGTLTGTFNNDVIIKYAADYVGLEREKQFIDKCKNIYSGINLVNTKDPALYQTNNGGIGDYWGNLSVEAAYYSFGQDTYANYLSSIITNQQFNVYNKNFGLLKSFALGGFNGLTNYAKTALQTNITNYLYSYTLANFDGTAKLHAFGCTTDSFVYKGDNKVTFWGTLSNNSFGFFFDSLTGTGYYIANEGGTAAMYRFNPTGGTPNVNYGLLSTLDVAWTGTTYLGTFTCAGAFQCPKPIDWYQGTKTNYFCVYAIEGGTNMLKWFEGTGSNYNLVGSVALGSTAPTSGFWRAEKGYPEIYGHNYGTSEVFKTGNLGFNTQHNTILSLGAANGTVFRNDFAFGTNGSGTYGYFFNSEKTTVYLDHFFNKYNTFQVSYSLLGINANVGTLDGYTFKDICEKISIVANQSVWFDGYGNLWTRDRNQYINSFNLSTSGNIEWGSSNKSTVTINSDVTKDINKVINSITVKGTTGVISTVITDSLSKSLYGTRKYEYENEFINTNADALSLGSMLIETTKFPKYELNASFPYLPPIEIMDKVNFTDSLNDVSFSGNIKRISQDFGNFQTNISAVEISTQKTGTFNNF